MRLIDKSAIPVIVVSGGMTYLAEQYQLPFLISPALVIFGLFALWVGVDTFIHDEIRLYNSLYSRRENYSGMPARLLGVIIFLFGAGVTLFAVWEWIQPSEAANIVKELVESSQSWGILIVTFGFFILLFGLVRLMAGSAHDEEHRNALVDFGFHARGFIGTVVGIFLFIVGLWVILKR